MKGLLRFVKLAIVNKDYARLLCLVSIILYVISLPIHTGIGVQPVSIKPISAVAIITCFILF